jgi:hypothetical protein
MHFHIYITPATITSSVGRMSYDTYLNALRTFVVNLYFTSGRLCGLVVCDYCSESNSLRRYTTVCHLMMVVWPKHVVAITSEEEKKNCCVDGPIIARNRKHHHGNHNPWLHIELISTEVVHSPF